MRLAVMGAAFAALAAGLVKDGEKMAEAARVAHDLRIAAETIRPRFEARRAGQKCPTKRQRELLRCLAQVHSPAWRAWAKLKPLERA